jgi:hypothetical protein
MFTIHLSKGNTQSVPRANSPNRSVTTPRAKNCFERCKVGAEFASVNSRLPQAKIASHRDGFRDGPDLASPTYKNWSRRDWT